MIEGAREAFAPSFLSAGGDMGARMRSHDWSTSPLGSPASWPQSLRTIVGVVLNARQPMFVAWGPELAFLYNDEYAPIFGAKHPNALGRPFAEVWSDIWPQIAPIVVGALAGDASYHEDLLIPMERNGYLEDAWFTFSYTPVADESGTNAGMLCAATETTRQILAERRVEDERKRQRRQFEQAPGFVAISSGPEHTFEFTNEAYARIAGSREYVGRTVRDALPEIAGQGFYELLDQVYATGKRYVASYASVRMQRTPDADLEERFVDLIYEPIFDEAGRVTGIFTQGHDVTDSYAAQQAMRESEERFRNMADHSPVMMWVTDPTGYCIYLNRRWYEFTGQSEAEGEGYGWLEATHPDDKEEAERAFVKSNAKREGFRVEYRLRRADGTYRWAIDAAAPRFGADGQYLGYVGSVIDIDERKEAEEHLRLLVNELNHRVKNSLATVQAIASQTFRNPDSFESSKRDFSARLISLAQAHDILTETNWSGATLRDVIVKTVGPHFGDTGDRFGLDGPRVILSPKSALAMSMALHELCTNAVKYGSLSVDGGRVEIQWSVVEVDGMKRLHMTWTEIGGPPVTTPARKGFGSRLIERGLASELDGVVNIVFDRDGVICTVDAALPAY